MNTVNVPVEPQAPNESGETVCNVRWMVSLPSGHWLGAWDKEAFAEYAMLAARPVDEVRPIAYACRTCNKIDWADTKEQLAQPEHVSYRGVDIGECKGKMIPLYAK